MKIANVVVAVLLATSSTVAFAKDVKVHVKGMVCAFCGQGITKKFGARPEVAKVDVSLKEKVVSLSLKDGQDIADKDIETILKDSGYNVEKIERP